MTKIQNAKKLIEEYGKEHAKNHYQSKLDELMKVYDSNNFSHITEKSGLETTLKFINSYES